MATAVLLAGSEILVAAPAWNAMRRDADAILDGWLRAVFDITDPRAKGPWFRRAAGCTRNLSGLIEERAIMLAARVADAPCRCTSVS